jgi:Ca2+-binding RTX toxin-like protein
MGGTRGRNTSFLAAVAATILLVVAVPASASTVSVSETPGYINQTLLSYQASAEEDNHLTIAAAAESNGYLELKVVDPGAEITAKAGCTDGPVDTEAICKMHVPKGFDYGPCSGHDCLPPTIPGTAWEADWTIALGDGDNHFDGSAFTDTYSESIAMTVSSGVGEDRIATGGGDDTIDPGAGSDTVLASAGHDQILTTADPDGPDVYESGDSYDNLSYALRTVPVGLNGSTAGAAGEDDQLHGYFNLIGGAADDVLVGGPNNVVLAGGPGNDSLSGGNPRSNELHGGTGDDRLSSASADAESISHLNGEEGDDFYYGGPGTNMMRETPDGPNPARSGGNDTAYGGEGTDYIELRAGDDLAYGGLGNDGVHGGMGEDRLFGGAGGDFVIGGSGYDQLFGGSGRDQLFSGWWTWNFPSPKRTFPFSSVHDDGSDRVDCGPDRDKAFSNPWDQVRRCEGERVRPHRKAQGKR